MTLSVAYLGPEGTFSQMAALNYFGDEVATVPFNTIKDVFQKVASKHVPFGVVPIENSTTGMIKSTVECLQRFKLKIVDELSLRINFQMARINSESDLKLIYAHAQALAQCKHWLNTHYPKVQYRRVSSNGSAAKMAAKDSSSAALCGENAVQIYGLKTVHQDINDKPNNRTRFLILGSL